jgi:hypothetical protein
MVELTPQASAAPGVATLSVMGDRSVASPGDRGKRGETLSFDLVTSAGAAACLSNAHAEVRITPHGSNQQMDIFASGLPANDTFTVFVLQLPHAPFGLAWYQGDIETNERGEGRGRFIGIFSDETFVVAPGVGPAPLIHAADATVNPQTAPVHLFHLGMWFDSVAEASAAGCPTGQTPFNGDHTAGIQVMNTTDFPDGDGPIGQFGN